MSLSTPQRLTVTVSALSPYGEGIAVAEGKEIYLPQTMIGEVLEVEVGEPFTPNSKRCPGKVLRFIKADPQHVLPEHYECAFYGRCGGCQLQHVSYEQQLVVKQQAIISALHEVEQQVGPECKLQGAIDDLVTCTSRPCRFKSLRYFGTDVQGALTLGFYAGRSHEVVPVDSCPLEPELFGVLSQSLLKLCQDLHLAAYQEPASPPVARKGKSKGKKQESPAASAATAAQAATDSEATCLAQTMSQPHPQLRALLWREGDDGAILGCLVLTQQPEDRIEQALRDWAQTHHVQSMVLSVNNSSGNALHMTVSKSLVGAEGITKTLLGQKFQVQAPTFLQVNYEVCERLYQAAIAHCVQQEQKLETAQRTGAGAVTAADGAVASADGMVSGVALDLYCGVGTMTLGLAPHFTQVWGVEVVSPSIAAAQANAVANGLSNTHFVVADVATELPRLLTQLKHEALPLKAIIADPSRAGLGAAVKALATVKGPCQLSLVFCALTALKRDLPPLLQAGWQLNKVQGFDMFPHSQHVETLVCLSKN